jgi:hypothetical protein
VRNDLSARSTEYMITNPDRRKIGTATTIWRSLELPRGNKEAATNPRIASTAAICDSPSPWRVVMGISSTMGGYDHAFRCTAWGSESPERVNDGSWTCYADGSVSDLEAGRERHGLKANSHQHFREAGLVWEPPAPRVIPSRAATDIQHERPRIVEVRNLLQDDECSAAKRCNDTQCPKRGE